MEIKDPNVSNIRVEEKESEKEILNPIEFCENES